MPTSRLISKPLARLRLTLDLSSKTRPQLCSKIQSGSSSGAVISFKENKTKFRQSTDKKCMCQFLLRSIKKTLRLSIL